MFNNPFREVAAANRNQRQQLDHLLRVTAPHERIILAGIGLVLLAAAAWVLFGSVVRSVTLDGLLIEQGERLEVVSNERGHLVEFLVQPGDRVEAGDPIARQSVPELERETESLRTRVELLEDEIRQAGGNISIQSALLSTARAALLQMEARSSASEVIVSPAGGKVMALRARPGEYLPAGASVAQLRNGRPGPPTAVLRIPQQLARRIEPGMPAAVRVLGPDSEIQELGGEVGLVTTGPIPGWLAALPPAVESAMSRVDVVFPNLPDSSIPDGTACRVRLVLGRQTPAALFDLGRS